MHILLRENNFSCANMDSLAWLGLRFWHRFQTLTTSSVSLFIWDKYWPFVGSFSPWITFVYSCKYIFQYHFGEKHPGTSRPTGSSTCETGVWSMGSWPPPASGLCFLQKSVSVQASYGFGQALDTLFWTCFYGSAQKQSWGHPVTPHSSICILLSGNKTSMK